jgi:cyclophilin family peptidyl-prolyl cis-trans isomerase
VGTEKRERQKQNRQQRLTELAQQQKRAKTKKRALQFGVGIPALVLALFLIVNVFSGDDNDNAAVDSVPADTTPAVTQSTLNVTTVPGVPVTGDTPCPKTDGTQDRSTLFEKSPTMCIDPAKSYTATFDTSEGEIVVALDTTKTPETVNNFVVLSRYKYYDNTQIFRTDPSIDIIQGGGFTNSDTPGYTIEDEADGFTYTEGDLAMARTSEPNSAGGQWFFVAGPKASALDSQGTYVNFGKVTEGLDVVKNILALNMVDAGGGDKPSRTVVVNSVTITES